MEESLCYVNMSQILICMSNRNVIKNQAFSIARKNLRRANFVEIGERTIIENQAFGIFILTIRKMLIKREN